MTVNRGPGVAVNAGVGTTTLEHRLQMAGLYAENAPGVPRSGVLAQATAQLVTAKATMAYDIGAAQLVINRTAGEGVYTPTLTGTTTAPTTAAPASNSRWDLVYVKQNDTAKGDADNLAVVGVVQGASGATPTKPYGTLPAGAYVLAEAQIFAGTTGTSGGANTITQVWAHTSSRGAPIPVRDTNDRATITTPVSSQEVIRLDLNGMRERWTGAKWVGPHRAEWTTMAAGLTASTVYNLGAMTADTPNTSDAAFVTQGASSSLVATDVGEYLVMATVKLSSASTGRTFISIESADTGGTSHAREPIPTGEDTGTVFAYIQCTAGQILYPKVFHSNAGTLTVTGRVKIKRMP